MIVGVGVDVGGGPGTRVGAGLGVTGVCVDGFPSVGRTGVVVPRGAICAVPGFPRQPTNSMAIRQIARLLFATVRRKVVINLNRIGCARAELATG